MAYVRKNQRDLTPAERRRFVDAVLELKRRGTYDDFVRLHIDHYRADGEGGLRLAHGAPSFLPWHRRLLLDFERALRRIDPTVTVPYWDWTRDNRADSPLWAADFMGGTGRPGDLQVTTGPFAYGGGRWPIAVAMTTTRFLTRDLGRPRAPLSLPTPADVERAMADAVYDVFPWDSTSRSGFRNLLEGWGPGSGPTSWRNHNRVHRWVGGMMLGGASVNDPVFWLHHSFVDLLWNRWQKRHPRSGYRPALPPPSGDPQHGRVAALHEPMAPWQVRPSDLLDVSHIYRYA